MSWNNEERLILERMFPDNYTKSICKYSARWLFCHTTWENSNVCHIAGNVWWLGLQCEERALRQTMVIASTV